MSEPISLVVIRNIINDFIPYRNLTYVDEDFNPTSKEITLDDVINGMKYFEYVLINAIDKDGLWIPIMVLHPEQSLDFSGQNFRKYIQIVTSAKRELRELIIVADSQFFNKSNLMNIISEFKTNGMKILTYNTENLAIVLPKHETMPLHELINDKDEIRALLAEIVNIPPTMPYTGGMNTWLGGKVGDIVKVTGHSETSGFAIRYYMIRP